MVKRLELLVWTIAWCTVGALAGILSAVKSGEHMISLPIMVIAPVIGCYTFGIRKNSKLVFIGILAAVGWLIAYSAGAEITIGRSKELERIARAPLGGFEWLIPCSLLSSLFVIGGVFGISLDGRQTK